MKKRLVLNNRVPRELLSNKLRYGALFLLIVLSMTVIVGMASSTDSILYTCEQNHIETHLEDGEFSVFVPLTEENLKNINDMGIEVEENFYISYTLEDNSDLRVFKNRESINLVQLLDGRLADSDNEIVIENNYALANGYSIGDSITLGSYTYTITGLGYTSDYNLVKKSISDVGADAEKFGTAFVTADTYNIMLSDSLLSVGEEYCYTYILGDESTSKELKDYLKDIELDTTQVENKYMKEIIDDVEKTKIDLKDGVKELSDGRDEINDAVKQFADGAAELLDATKTLEDGSNELCDGIKELYNGTSELYDNNNELVDGISELSDASIEIYDGSKDLLDGATSLDEGVTELQESVDDLINEYFDFSYQNLSSFVENENNSRIWDYEDDSNTNKMSAIFAGIVVLVMIAYVISVFIMHNIDNESKIIGALYALGYNKKELLSHFLRLPVMISFVGGILGTVLGFATASFQTESSASYYSYGEVQYIQPLYLIVYGIVIPTVITLLVNIIVINKKLSSTPLQLLRKERKENNVSNVNLKDMKFIHKFQIRQFIREFRGNITLFFGVFISILMMVFSFTIYSSIHNMTLHTTDDIKFQYMYTLKFPDDTPPDNCETAYTEGLYTYFDLLGSDLEVSVQGIQKDSNYFNFDVHDTEKNEVYVSSSASIKFGWTTGDTIVLKNDIDGTNYALNVKGVVQYSNGLYIFMDIDAMRELFNQEDDYFNTLFSNEELDIESGRINNIITYQDIDDVSSIFMNLMQDMIVMILALSVVIFIIVLYLLLRLMIDKASFSISLIKVFGYNNKEIKKLYLDGNFYTILVTLIVGIPISRVIINAIYPSLVANVNAGMDLSWSLDMYIILVVIVLVTYLIIDFLLNRYLKKISLVEILKDRE